MPMKPSPRHFVPLLALLLAAAWLGLRQREIARMETETRQLRERMAVAAGRAEQREDASLATSRRKPAGQAGRVDWKQMAARLLASGGGMAEMGFALDFQLQLKRWSAAELRAALEEIAALDLPAAGQRRLEEMLAEALAVKDPGQMLAHFQDRLHENHGTLAWRMRDAFRIWTERDPAAALAWLDAQTAAGRLESRSLDGIPQSRLRLESIAILHLLRHDPAGVEPRLAGLPPEQRGFLLQQSDFLHSLPPGGEVAVAGLIRNHLPAAEQADAIARMALRELGRDGDLEKVNRYLQTIEAGPEERLRAAEGTALSHAQKLAQAGTFDRAALDEIRYWTAIQAPDDLDRITGRTLANLGSTRVPWETSVALLREIHAENPSDALLESFLQGYQARQHPESAAELAGQITDETRRAAVLRQLQNELPAMRLSTDRPSPP